jgi:hypothetical protein
MAINPRKADRQSYFGCGMTLMITQSSSTIWKQKRNPG